MPPRSSGTVTALRHALLIVLAMLFALPLVVMFTTSLKSVDELAAAPYQLWPTAWQWSNYGDALATLPLLKYLGNTLLICIGSVAGTLFSCSLAAYGFARLRWPGRDVLFGLVLATMLLPWHVTMIPRFVLLTKLGLYNSLGALIWPTFFGDAFSIFLLRQFFRSIPEQLSEAARLDGCGEWRIFWHVVLPLARPALVTMALFQFMAAWNDLNGPLLLLSDPDKLPLSYGLERFVSSYSTETHLLMAAATLFTLPLVVLFFFAQRVFLQGIATTGLKS